MFSVLSKDVFTIKVGGQQQKQVFCENNIEMIVILKNLSEINKLVFILKSNLQLIKKIK